MVLSVDIPPLVIRVICFSRSQNLHWCFSGKTEPSNKCLHALTSALHVLCIVHCSIYSHRHFSIYGFSKKMLPHLTFGLSLHFDELFVSEMAMIRLLR